RPRSALDELLGERPGLGLGAAAALAVVEDEVGAGLAELLGDDAAQSPRAPGDQRDPALTGSHSMSSCVKIVPATRKAPPDKDYDELMAATRRSQALAPPRASATS